MQELKNKIKKVIIHGIPTIIRAVINKDDSQGVTYNLIAEGTGLQQVMNIPGINQQKTKTNHFLECETVLGIEAARQTIINEISYTMKSHGMQIDPRHIQLTADVMTCKGEVFGYTRFGMPKMKSSTLMMASFEKTSDHLFEAAIHSRVDNIQGVSECIIVGNRAPLGTGSM